MIYLLDTNVISERRKGARANPCVIDFLNRNEDNLYLPVQVIAEIKAGIERLRIRGDLRQVQHLERWFDTILDSYSGRILNFDLRCALVWAKLMGANPHSPVDKQIAAIALVYDLTLVTRNTDDFVASGLRLLNPFLSGAPL